MPLTVSLLVSLCVALIAWGANDDHTEKHDEQFRDLDALTRSHDRSIAAMNAQYSEIVKRPDYIG